MASLEHRPYRYILAVSPVCTFYGYRVERFMISLDFVPALTFDKGDIYFLQLLVRLDCQVSFWPQHLYSLQTQPSIDTMFVSTKLGSENNGDKHAVTSV
jgi:hypothetical protein